MCARCALCVCGGITKDLLIADSPSSSPSSSFAGHQTMAGRYTDCEDECNGKGDPRGVRRREGEIIRRRGEHEEEEEKKRTRHSYKYLLHSFD